MGGILDYPAEIKDAVTAMFRLAGELEQKMAELNRTVNLLAGSSQGAAIAAFEQAQHAWNKDGILHNDTLKAVGKVAGESYDEITEYDRYIASQLHR